MKLASFILVVVVLCAVRVYGAEEKGGGDKDKVKLVCIDGEIEEDRETVLKIPFIRVALRGDEGAENISLNFRSDEVRLVMRYVSDKTLPVDDVGLEKLAVIANTANYLGLQELLDWICLRMVLNTEKVHEFKGLSDEIINTSVQRFFGREHSAAEVRFLFHNKERLMEYAWMRRDEEWGKFVNSIVKGMRGSSAYIASFFVYYYTFLRGVSDITRESKVNIKGKYNEYFNGIYSKIYPVKKTHLDLVSDAACTDRKEWVDLIEREMLPLYDYANWLEKTKAMDRTLEKSCEDVMKYVIRLAKKHQAEMEPKVLGDINILFQPGEFRVLDSLLRPKLMRYINCLVDVYLSMMLLKHLEKFLPKVFEVAFSPIEGLNLTMCKCVKIIMGRIDKKIRKKSEDSGQDCIEHCMVNGPHVLSFKSNMLMVEKTLINGDGSM